MTRVLRVDAAHPDQDALTEAARVLQAGGLVVFPTETVYGLGADAANARAVARIYRVKGRPADNPLILHVATPAAARRLAERASPAAALAMAAFWPGPFTAVLPVAEAARPLARGMATVAVRIPNHPVALGLLAAVRIPVAAPSANRSGRPSPTRAQDAVADLVGQPVDLVLDAGSTGVGVESTVVDFTGPVPRLLRPGGISREELGRVLGEVLPAGSAGEEAPRSPGMKYRHYAPSCEVWLVEGNPARVPGRVRELALGEQARGRRVGVLCMAETARGMPGEVFVLGGRDDPGAQARRLFRGLRSLEGRRVELIVAEGPSGAGLGATVLDRLRRAAARVEVVP
jgi:L-threonylcarbamoyladenylate synthase